MLPVKALKTWYRIHTWSSLICTVFLLGLCLTGLPLIFRDEIDHWLDDSPPLAVLPAETPRVPLDRLVETGQRLYPDQVVKFVYIDDQKPRVVVTMAPS